MLSIEIIAGVAAVVAAVYAGVNRILSDTYKALALLVKIQDASEDNTKHLEAIDKKLEHQDQIQDKFESRLDHIAARLTKIESNCFNYRHEQVQTTQEGPDT